MVGVNPIASKITVALEKSRDRVAAASVIAGHALHHAYDYGLYVILPVLYTEFGLTPVAAGLVDTVGKAVGQLKKEQ